MDIRTVDNASKVLELPGITGRSLHIKGNMELVHLELEHGKLIQEHVLPLHVIFFILEGQATFNIDSDYYTLERNQYIEVLPNIKRAVYNKSKENLKILVIKQNNNKN